MASMHEYDASTQLLFSVFDTFFLFRHTVLLDYLAKLAVLKNIRHGKY
jgi:hypothetical protein